VVKVSIIIPALNEAKAIGRCVASTAQAGVHEVIVIDGGSTDDTVQIATELGCRVMTSDPGRAIQQNLGASHATGDVLLFLHADAWLAEDAVRQVEQAMANASVKVGAMHQRIEADARIYRLIEWGNAWRAKWRGLPYGDQAIFIRRELFDQVGRFPQVALMEDLLLMRHLRRQSWPVLIEGPVHVGTRRWQKHGVLRQTLRNWCLFTASAFGVSPDRLAKYYARH